MNWIDTHCHLEMIEGDTKDVVSSSMELGVDKMVTIGTSPANNKQVLSNIKKFDNVYGTLGVHPNDANQQAMVYLDGITEELSSNKKILAIGECGFDFFRQQTSLSDQRVVFEKQMQMALELKLPIVIHSRQAEEETIAAMEPYLKKGLKALFHCFTSKDILFELGMRFDSWFSYNAIATFKKGDEIREFLLKTPTDKILIETDSPYLAPAPYRGKGNIPGYVSIIGKELAGFLNIGEAEFMKLTYDNCHTFYDRLKLGGVI
ncbi:MAG: TatD family hydrolase [SAR324 cluster bacterium]|nr:TatD family hydrolase [SAR324 cluster bacterium]